MATQKIVPIETGEPPVMAAIRSLRDLIESSADADELATDLSEEVFRALEEADVHRLMVPRVLGGMEADPQLVIDALSTLSYYDGSTGWYCQAATTGTAFTGAYLGDRAVDAIFHSGKKLTCAGGAAPPGKCERVGDGYRISGTFGFGTGSRNASWLGCGYLLHKDGALDLNEKGEPTLLMAVAPREKVEIADNWDVLGLRATGSYDFTVLDQVVHEDFVFSPANPEQKRGGPLYGMGFRALPSLAHSSFAIGCSRRALDEWANYAKSKKKMPTGTISEMETYQRNMAVAYAELRAAEAYVRNAFDALFKATGEGNISDELRLNAKLATSHALLVGTRVAQTAFSGCTTTALRNGNRIQRSFRDMQAGNAHFMTGEASLIEAGRFLAGIEGATAF